MRAIRRSMVFGAAIGAAIAFLADPVSGRGRRARLRDQGTALMRQIQRKADARRRYLEGVREGIRAEMASPGPDDRHPDDGKLEQRIRSTVFGSSGVRTDTITLEVVQGSVVIRGQVETRQQADELRTRVMQVPGVQGVEVLLHLPGEPAPNKEPAIRASHEAEATTEHINRLVP